MFGFKKKKTNDVPDPNKNLIPLAGYYHINGLPVPKSAFCVFELYCDRIELLHNEINIKLPLEQVTSISTAINEYIPSEKSKSHLLLITYTSEGELKYIRFKTSKNCRLAKKIVKEFNKLKGPTTVEIGL